MSVSEEKENSPSSICCLLVANDERKEGIRCPTKPHTTIISNRFKSHLHIYAINT